MIRRLVIFFATSVGALCFGLIFIVIFVNATEVDCTLQSDDSYMCQIRTLLLGRVQIFERHVEDIVDITIVDDGCSDGCSYRAEFIRSDGQQVPLSEVYTDRGPVLQQVNGIRAQMDRHVERMTYTMEPPWWVLWLVGGLALMSMLLSLLSLFRR
jgi:hypothetical protein